MAAQPHDHAATASIAPPTIYSIDPAHTMVEFAVKHLFTWAKGRFANANGEISYDAADPTRSSVTASVDAASVDTRANQRDTHLRSADFFDIENHPTINFRSREVRPTGEEGVYHVKGDLTIRGVTREVTFEATFLGIGPDPWGGQRLGLSAQATINRKEYNLLWNAPVEAGGFLLGDQVKITLDVQAVRQG